MWVNSKSFLSRSKTAVELIGTSEPGKKREREKPKENDSVCDSKHQAKNM